MEAQLSRVLSSICSLIPEWRGGVFLQPLNSWVERHPWHAWLQAGDSSGAQPVRSDERWLSCWLSACLLLLSVCLPEETHSFKSSIKTGVQQADFKYSYMRLQTWYLSEGVYTAPWWIGRVHYSGWHKSFCSRAYAWARLREKLFLKKR